jgi:SWIM zinc finger
VAYSTEQILALAPDAASAKAASQLVKATNWLNLGADARAVWGECQGSGKEPYRVQVDLGVPAFKCTCPSRKFPCKHGLALLLLNATDSTLFSDESAPQWVADWLASREQRAAREESKAAAPPELMTPEKQIAREAAQARRARERNTRVASGLEELKKWLDDLAREGFASLRSRGMKPWDDMAARLVDAQAPGVANRLRRASAWPFLAGVNGWEKYLARDLANLYLFADTALKTAAALDAHDINAVLGVAVRYEDVLAGAGVADCWRVIGQRTTDEDAVRLRANWLQGERTRRYALVLQFAQKAQGFDRQFLAASEFEGELAFYPGKAPLRALLKTQQAVSPAASVLTPDEDPWGWHASLLAANPFLTEAPMTLTALPVRIEGRFMLRMESGCIAMHHRFQGGWHLLGLSGGKPLTLFGEWDGDTFFPFSAQESLQLVNFNDIALRVAA